MAAAARKSGDAPIQRDIKVTGTSTEGKMTMDTETTASSAVDDFLAGMVGGAANGILGADGNPLESDDDEVEDTDEEGEAEGETDEDEEADEETDEEEETEEEDEEEETDEEKAAAAAKAAAKAGRPPKKELVKVNDGKGSREVEIDFTDRPALVRYVQQAYGAMKLFNRERAAVARAEKAEAAAAEKAEQAAVAEDLETLLATEGEDAVVKHLTGKTVEEHLTRRAARTAWLKDPKRTDAEREELYKREAKEEVERQRAFDKKKAERASKQVSEKEADLDRKQLQAMVNPVFNKARFAGKIGDAALEQRLDSMMWNEIRLGIDEVYKSGVEELTPEIVAGIVKDARDTLGAGIDKQATKKAGKVLASKKAKAKNAAASAARKGGQALGKQNTGAPAEFDPMNLAHLTSAMFAEMHRKPKRRK